MTPETDSLRPHAWSSVRSEIEALFAELWACPEMPGMEYRTVDSLIDFLERHGFEVERGSGGVPTAFVARRGAGAGPRIGILAEYDALASLDNEAVPYRKGTGRKPGHGCGHNHIGPANSGAGIAAAIAAAQLGLAGEIVVVGCPAEEIGWGKIALQGAGVFDDLDVVLTSHGDYQNGALSRPCHAVMSGEFVFRGDSAHGGKADGAQCAEGGRRCPGCVRGFAARAFSGSADPPCLPRGGRDAGRGARGGQDLVLGPARRLRAR